MVARSVALVLLMLAALSLASAQTLPFELIDNRVFVDVFLNGKGPYRFIFDTGAVAVLTESVARELKVDVEDAGESGGVGEKRVRSGTTRLHEVRLGDIVLRDENLGVISGDDTPAVFGSKPLHGIIGLPVFERAVVTFDYMKHQVTLVPPEKFTPDKNSIVVPFKLRGQIPVVDGALDGLTGRFAVDTGARSSLLVYGPFADRNRLREKYHAHLEGITGWGIGGPVRSLLARAASFRLGTAELHDLVIRLSTQRAGATTASDIAGLIGPDILKQFTVTFDYPHSRMLLVMNNNYGRRDTWDRTGMWMAADAPTATEWNVLDVMPGSPAAEAGVQVHDRILRVDGRDVAHLVLPEVRDSLRTRSPGTKVKFDVKRATGVATIEITLRDIV